MARATVSCKPPADTGTITLTGLEGKAARALPWRS
jgi:hypothetical protein